MTDHTPGPWVIQFESCECEPPCSCGGPYPHNIYAPARRVKPYKDLKEEAADIANFTEVNFWLPSEERDANARLIAAAPDLLEAMAILTRIVKGRFEGLEIVALVPGELRAAVTIADAAIAKATGEGKP